MPVVPSDHGLFNRYRIRQLVWHDHEGWLTTAIHFDFHPTLESYRY